GVSRRERSAPDSRRDRLLQGVSVRAGRARYPDQSDLRGHERDFARAGRAHGTPRSRRATQGAGESVQGSAALDGGDRLVSRASAALERTGGDETKAAADLDYARIFVPMAMRRARRSVRALGRNQDARLKAIAERALESGELVAEV